MNKIKLTDEAAEPNIMSKADQLYIQLERLRALYNCKIGDKYVTANAEIIDHFIFKFERIFKAIPDNILNFRFNIDQYLGANVVGSITLSYGLEVRFEIYGSTLSLSDNNIIDSLGSSIGIDIIESHFDHYIGDMVNKKLLSLVKFNIKRLRYEDIDSNLIDNTEDTIMNALDTYGPLYEKAIKRDEQRIKDYAELEKFRKEKKKKEES